LSERVVGATPGSAPAPLRRSRLARNVLVATGLAILVFSALAVYGDVNALVGNLRRFAWGWFALAVALATSNYVLRYLRWNYYLRLIGVEVPHGESALVFLSGFVMSVTPAKLGEVLKSLLLYESRGTSIALTAPVVVAERLTDLMALVALTALGCLSFEQGVPIAIAGAVIVTVVLATCAWRPLAELALRVANRIPVVQRAVPRLREAYESLHRMTRPMPLLIATVLAVAAWSMEVVALGAVLAGFEGIEVGWEATTFAYSASTIAGALAMLPGGLGVTEAGMTGLLQTLGGGAMTAAIATAATILVRLATLWWAVLIGLAALALFRRRMRNLGNLGDR